MLDPNGPDVKKDVYKRQAFLWAAFRLSMEKDLAIYTSKWMSFKFGWPAMSWETVSYTHLDVYKRQVYTPFPNSWNTAIIRWRVP